MARLTTPGIWRPGPLNTINSPSSTAQQDIAGNPSKKCGVVSIPCCIHIPHILKSEEIADLARRDEGGGAEITGDKGKPAEGNGMELGLVGNRLLDRVTLSIVPILISPLRSGLRRPDF